MKILWVSHFLLYPDTGYGGLQRSRNLLKELSKAHEVDLVCLVRDVDQKLVPDLSVPEQDLKKYCTGVHFIPHGISRIRKIGFLLRSLFQGVPYSVQLYRSEGLVRLVQNLLTNEPFDVVHADTIGLIDHVVGRHAVGTSLAHHDVESHKMYRRYENENHPIKKWFFYIEYRNLLRYEKNHCHEYGLNIVVSELDRERLLDMDPGARAVVIENGVDCEYFSYFPRGAHSEGLVFTGALDYYPNSNAMLYFSGEIWPVLKEEYPHLTLTIIGKSPSVKLRSSLASCNGVQILGYVKDIRPHMRTAKIFICPIREGGGTRIKILDAFAQGIPVVSTKIGAEGLDVVHGEHLLIADSPPDFVQAIKTLLEDDALTDRIGRNARAYVEKHYSFTHIGEKLSHAYLSLGPKATQ